MKYKILLSLQLMIMKPNNEAYLWQPYFYFFYQLYDGHGDITVYHLLILIYSTRYNSTIWQSYALFLYMPHDHKKRTWEERKSHSEIHRSALTANWFCNVVIAEMNTELCKLCNIWRGLQFSKITADFLQIFLH